MKKDFIGGKQITRKQALKGLYPIWGVEKSYTWGSDIRVPYFRVISNGTFIWGPWELSRTRAIWSWLKMKNKCLTFFSLLLFFVSCFCTGFVLTVATILLIRATF